MQAGLVVGHYAFSTRSIGKQISNQNAKHSYL